MNIFSTITEEALVEAINLQGEVHVDSGLNLIHKGDQGSSMFIITEGKMRIHDGDLTLNYLYRFDIFAEMAAFDPEVCSASIPSITDTSLYQLDQESLLHLVETQSAVTRRILHIFSQWIPCVIHECSGFWVAAFFLFSPSMWKRTIASWKES